MIVQWEVRQLHSPFYAICLPTLMVLADVLTKYVSTAVPECQSSVCPHHTAPFNFLQWPWSQMYTLSSLSCQPPFDAFLLVYEVR